MHGATEKQRRASVWEIVGAWLHLWTPPRDVEVPPVPWRKMALWTGVGVLVLGVALAIMIPRIDAGKESRNAQAAAHEAAARKANRERIIKLQQPRTGAFASLKPERGASSAQVNIARAQLITGLEGAVFADARKRAAAGEISKVTGPTTCTQAEGSPRSGPLGLFDCYVVVRKVPKVATNVAGSIGYPFRAVVNYDNFTYAFCRTEQFPGEQLIPDPRTVVQLPAACRVD
jgi:hypothetical protein